MSVRSWRTTLEETIVSEYVDSIITRKKKKPQSPYCTSSSTSNKTKPPSNKKAYVTKSASLTNISHSSPYKARPRSARPSSARPRAGSVGSVRSRDGSLGSVTSLASSQLSVYSAQLEGSSARLYEGKRAKRVKLFRTKEVGKFVVIDSFNELHEKVHHAKLYTSDGTHITHELFDMLPHNCHVFVSDPTSTQSVKPKVMWTKDGIVVSGVQSKKGTKTNLNERMQRLVGAKKSRVQIFKNGEFDKGVQIVDGSVDVMIRDCSDALGMSVSGLYTAQGDLIDADDEMLPVLKHSHIKGPLWATKGAESFSYIGAQTWLQQQQKLLRKDIEIEQEKIAQGYLDEIADDKLSAMQAALDMMRDSLRSIGGILGVISDRAFDEEYEGAKFRLRKIPQLSDTSRLIGRPNIRINISVNGRSVESRVIVIPGGTFHPTMDWLLEQCQATHHKSLATTTQKATTLYKEDGSTLKHISELDNDANLFLSFGEPFKPATVRTFLDLAFYAVTVYDFPDNPTFAVKRPLEDDELLGQPKDFRVVNGVPENYKLNEQFLKRKAKEIKSMLVEMLPRQIFSSSTFLQNKSKSQTLIRPELAFNEYTTAKSSGLSASSQVWVYTRKFQLKCRTLPKLYLTVSDDRLLIKHKDETIEGYTVTLSNNPDSTWQATTNGMFICNRTGLHLTLIEESMSPSASDSSLNTQDSYKRQHIHRSESSEKGQFDTYSSTTIEAPTVPRNPEGEPLVLGALPYLDKLANQRWAFKQEAIPLLGQWKLCNIDNPVWGKECLSWPTNKDGSTNEEIAWPMEGLLFPKPPPMSAPRKSSDAAPLRLAVKPNGSCHPGQLITAPDLTNMRKDLIVKRRLKQINYQPDTHKWLSVHQKDIEIEEKEEILELEMRLFLDRCKTVLDCPKPLTRIFNELGDELVSLESLSRDDTVYVSCGKGFIIPDIDQAARNKLVHDIASDVDLMKTYCSIIAPSKYILGVDKVKKSVQLQLSNEEVEEIFDIDGILGIAERNKSFGEAVEDDEAISEVSEYGYHGKSHQHNNDLDNQLVTDFPWRNPAFIAGVVKNKNDWESTTDNEDNESIASDSLKSATSLHNVRHQPCNQWIYKNRRFFLLEEPRLVLGVLDDTSIGVVPYKSTDFLQQWDIVETFVYNSNGQVLTVQSVSVMPPQAVDYTGAQLKLVPLIDAENGNSSQKWSYSAKTGHLTPFAGSAICQGISAALQAKLCTYSITGTLNTQQPTYIMENPGLKGIPSENSYIYVCGSCVTSLRDRYNVEKCDVTSYVCSIGYFSAHKGLKIRSSLCALNGLDGLNIEKAYGTLYLWENMLRDVREMGSLEEIQSSVKQTLQLECVNEGLVLVRCYVNGKGTPKRGALFLASGIDEILKKASIDLKMGRPATRIFLTDSTEIFSFAELLDDTESSVPYREVVISTGEQFVKSFKTGSPANVEKQIKKLNSLRLSSTRSLPPHLPKGVSKQALPVFVTRNGSSQPAVRVVAHSTNSLLEIGTSRLNMASSARRVFTSEGREIKSWSEIMRDQCLVLSVGEGFVGKDNVKENSSRKHKWLQRRLHEKSVASV